MADVACADARSQVSGQQTLQQELNRQLEQIERGSWLVEKIPARRTVSEAEICQSDVPQSPKAVV